MSPPIRKPLERMSLVELNDLWGATRRISKHACDEEIRYEAVNLLKRIEAELKTRTEGRAW